MATRNQRGARSVRNINRPLRPLPLVKEISPRDRKANECITENNEGKALPESQALDNGKNVDRPISPPVAALELVEEERIDNLAEVECGKTSVLNNSVEFREPFHNISVSKEFGASPNESPKETLSPRDNIIYCREKLFMRKDSYLSFVSTDGSPLDEGSRQLNEIGKLPRL